jgi:hypothetical protein
MYINYLQNHYLDLLPLTQLAYNILSSATIEHSLSSTNNSFYLRFNALSIQPTRADSVTFNAKMHATLISKICESLKKYITST